MFYISKYLLFYFNEILLLQIERYVDKKLDKAEQLLKNGESRTRRWYHSITGDTSFKPTEFHFFLSYFVGGFALGIVSGKLI